MKYKGLLDAGHFELRNQGVIKEYYESESNLRFAKKLKIELEATGLFEIDLTREDEKDISLSNRGRMAKGYDFFLSIHSDSAGNSTGSLVIDSVDLETEDFAARLTAACALGYGIPVKQVREREYKDTGEDYYTVMDKAQDIGCPLVHILERANHSYIKDCEKLMNETLEDRAIKNIVEVYKEYFIAKSHKMSNKKVQNILKDESLYTDVIDGKLGPNSQKAIRGFQSRYHLQITGTVNAETEAKLKFVDDERNKPVQLDYKKLYEAEKAKNDELRAILNNINKMSEVKK